MIRIGVGLALACAAAALPRAHAGAAEPGFQPLRYDEDWSALCEPSARRDALDALKCIRLGAPDRWLTLGADARERFEWTRNPGFGAAGRDDDGQWLHRAYVHGDLRLGPRARVFAQLRAVYENGRAPGPRATDDTSVDLHQGFADAVLAPGGVHTTVRLGRQELRYGSQRLVAVRESPNARRSFDAVRAIVSRGAWRADLFASRPVEVDPSAFDDESERGTRFAGVYAVRTLPGDGALDLYWLALGDEDAGFARGEGGQQRHSFGTRLAGSARGFDWDFEAVLQAGRFDGGGLLAWTFASDTGHRFEGLPFRPRLDVKADIASGDRGGSRLGTFDALFPRGSYFGEAALVGPQNLMDVHPGLALALHERLDATVSHAWFWRHRREDGVYDAVGRLVRGPGGARAREIGRQLSAGLEWRPGRRWTLALEWQRFWPGDFLEETGAAKRLDFVATWIQWRL